MNPSSNGPPAIPVSVEFRGKGYLGSYAVERGMLVVRCDFGTVSAYNGGPRNAGAAARAILRDLLNDEYGTGRLD